MRQRAVRSQRRFQPRIGAAVKQPGLQYQTREIVSEYGYAAYKDAPESLHEFRQVISVDGKPVKAQAKARETLTQGLLSNDDRIKKRMLRDFEKYGLLGAANDFGQVILLFTRRELARFSFTFRGLDRVGAEAVSVLQFSEKEGPGALTIFEGREAIRLRLSGQIWARSADYLPLRVMLEASRTEKDEEKTLTIRDVATVDYTLGSQGVLLPVSVKHSQYMGDILTMENVFQYAGFRKFGADAEIKFDTALPEEEPKKK